MLRIYVEHHGVCPLKRSSGIYRPLALARSDGDNIADRLSFGEMRGHYFVWKNSLHPWTKVGFVHYRRWFNFYPRENDGVVVNSSERFAELVGLAPHPFRLDEVDAVLAWPWKFNQSVAAAYQGSHRPQDWQVLSEVCPEIDQWAKSVQQYYVCNMFILKSRLFDGYMSFWWERIQEIEKRIKDLPPPSDYQHRALAFLSERMFSFWVEQKLSDLKVWEVPLIMDASL